MGNKLRRGKLKHIRKAKAPETIGKQPKLVYPSPTEEEQYKEMLQEKYYLAAEREFDEKRLMNYE